MQKKRAVGLLGARRSKNQFFASILSCWKTAIRTRNQERRIWTAVSILLLILTINRLLDLQSAPLEIVRALAVEEGWYKQHEVLQVGFIIFIAIVCVAAVVNLLMWVRSPPRSTRVALLATILLFGFVLIRATSLHYIDHIRWKGIFELAVITMVFLASQWRQNRDHRLRVE